MLDQTLVIPMVRKAQEGAPFCTLAELDHLLGVISERDGITWLTRIKHAGVLSLYSKVRFPLNT